MITKRFIKNSSFLESNTESMIHRQYLILLNSNAYQKNHLLYLFRRSKYLICADGGANILHDNHSQGETIIIPKAIVGDLDSLRPKVRKFYESRATLIKKVDD